MRTRISGGVGHSVTPVRVVERNAQPHSLLSLQLTFNVQGRRTWLWNWLHGGLPVAISMTVQATDQMSAWRPWPVCLITSGAIQYGVPLIDLNPESAHASAVLTHCACTTGRGAAALPVMQMCLPFSR